MTRLRTIGFELNDLLGGVNDGDGGTFGTATIQTSVVRSGSRALQCSGSGSQGAQADFGTPVLGTNYYGRAYVRIPSGGLPASEIELVGAGPGGFLFTIRLESDGTLTLWAFIGGATWTQQGSASAAVTLDAWQKIELRWNVGTGSIDQCEGRLNGVTFASASGLNVTDATAANGFAVGNNINNILTLASASIYADDVAVNDSSGANQNSWPPESKIVLLIPASDNAKGTGWTNDAATTTNLFDAANNEPPAGIADTTAGSGLHQLRNATSNANVNYDANLTTYSAAGINAGDTINVVVPMVATAAPVTTSAKQGTIGVASNPTIANVSLGAGGTAGAFWSGVAAGTYPTGWKWSFGTTTYAPTVTVGTAPVARITQVTASTRIAMVCAMGLYVDYTPAAPKSLVFENRRVARNSLLRR